MPHAVSKFARLTAKRSLHVSRGCRSIGWSKLRPSFRALLGRCPRHPAHFYCFCNSGGLGGPVYGAAPHDGTEFGGTSTSCGSLVAGASIMP